MSQYQTYIIDCINYKSLGYDEEVNFKFIFIYYNVAVDHIIDSQESSLILVIHTIVYFNSSMKNEFQFSFV